MAATSTALTTKVESGSPYQLDPNQTLKASKALLKHIKDTSKAKLKASSKKNLLADNEDSDGEEVSDARPIWLQLTTKKHIVDKKRLKPSKIPLPHPINTSATSTILLITGDQQRAYKDLVDSPAFPAELRKRITRVIDNKKLKAKYSQYEAQRQLRDSHDIILADDRIITALPAILGKTFYKSAIKRPIPIDMQPPATRNDEGKRLPRLHVKKDPSASKAYITPQKLAAEIEKTLSCALVALSPSVSTAVRVGMSNWTAEQIAENVKVVVENLITKFVPGKWRGVRGLHLKGESTAALPIWLADELWTGEGDVLDVMPEEANVGKKRKAIEAGVEGNKKRKAIEGATKESEPKNKKAKSLGDDLLPESNDAKLDKEIALRKETLKKQKKEAARDMEGEGEIPVLATAKSEKVKKKGRSKGVSVEA